MRLALLRAHFSMASGSERAAIATVFPAWGPTDISKSSTIFISPSPDGRNNPHDGHLPRLTPQEHSGIPTAREGSAGCLWRRGSPGGGEGGGGTSVGGFGKDVFLAKGVDFEASDDEELLEPSGGADGFGGFFASSSVEESEDEEEESLPFLVTRRTAARTRRTSGIAENAWQLPARQV